MIYDNGEKRALGGSVFGRSVHTFKHGVRKAVED